MKLCAVTGDCTDLLLCSRWHYDIYDYRNPGELRIDAQAEAIVTGHLKTGAITHELARRGRSFCAACSSLASTRLRIRLSTASCRMARCTLCRFGEHLSANRAVSHATNIRLQSAGPRRLWEDNHQSAAIVQDRIHFPGRIQLLAGGRFDSLRDHNYSLASTSPDAPILPTSRSGCRSTQRPSIPVNNLTLYGNYGVMLSLGPQAPWWVDNASQFLSPFLTRQAEMGAKYEPGQRFLLTTAFFHMRAPFFYPKIIQAPDSFCPASEFHDPGDQCFESEGRETHDGIELNAEGQGRELAAADGLGGGDSRDFRRHRHAGLR